MAVWATWPCADLKGKYTVSLAKLACEQAHLLFRVASPARRMGRGEWGEEK